MKIFFVVPSLKAGGLERVASLLASYWSTMDNIEVCLVTLDSKSPFYLLHKDVSLVQAPAKVDDLGGWRKAVFLWFWLRKLAKKIEPSIILSFGEGYNSFVQANLQFLGLPIFLSNRTTPITSLQGNRGVINPFFYRRAHCVFVQTRKSIEVLSSKYKGTRFEVVPNPIKDISNTPDYGKQTILNVGSLGGKKNQLGLIKIFARLSKKYPDWRLIFAGDGPNRTNLEAYVKELGLQKQIHFKGIVTDLDKLYGESSIFAFTSLLEGFPNALGEAMRAGMAVIAYDCLTGPSELINDGENGFLIKQEDDLKYQIQLEKLISNIQLRADFGAKAHESMEPYNIGTIAHLYLKHFSNKT